MTIGKNINRSLATILLTGGLAYGGLMVATVGSASAQTAPNLKETGSEESEINEQDISPRELGDQIDEAIENWFARLNQRKQKRGSTEVIEPGVETADGSIYYATQMDISVLPSNPSWVKARSTGFEKALLEIRAEFINNQFGYSINKDINKLDEDNSSNNREFKDEGADGRSKLEAIWEKALTLGETHLDRLLQENGVDPSELNSLPPAQRKDLFVESYVSNKIRKAVGDSSGILPVQTFVANNQKGDYVIGVIAKYSPKLKQLAYDIAHGVDMGPVGKKGRAISSFYDYDDARLADTMGLRLVIDETGYPALVSFGQWGYQYKGKSNSKLKRSRRSAGSQAEDISVKQIVDFINASISFNKESDTGEIIENFLIKQGNSITEQDITHFVDKISKTVVQNSSGSTAGIRTVKKWNYDHPLGHEIIGRVSIWTRTAFETSENVKNFKPNNGQTATKEEAVNMEANISEGIEFDDGADF